MIHQRITSKLALFTCVVLISNCGGASLSGNNNIIKKKERTTASEDDGDAKDPQVVTGAYLTCEISLSDTADAPANERAVGCNILKADGKPLNIGTTTQVEFSAKTPGKDIPPKSTNTPTNYQAVFNIAKAMLPSTTYHAKLLSAGKLIKELDTTVKNSSSPLKVTENVAATWIPAMSMGTDIFLRDPNCPLRADDYCDANGRIKSTNPATPEAINSCAKFLSGFSDLATLFSKFAPPDEERKTIELGSSFCTVPKKIGGEMKYLTKGTGCSVAAITDANGGHPRTIIYKNASFSNFDIVEKRLRALDCKNPR